MAELPRSSGLSPVKTLILGGTTEASALARLLAGDGRFDAVLSLAGATRAPAPPPIRWRVGGFGGAAGLAEFLGAGSVAALIDATHPFATRISDNAAQAADLAGVPRLVVSRPAWRPGPGDRWRFVDTMQAAAEALGFEPRRVLLTVGRKDLAPFAARPWHRYVVRSVEPPGDVAPQGATIITARGPFDAAAERRLLQDHGIEVIVTKNSGGVATVAKLDAARALSLPVIMLERPAPPPGETVADAAAALRWLAHQAARGV